MPRKHEGCLELGIKLPGIGELDLRNTNPMTTDMEG